MGVPSSEVGYTSATTGRETTKSMTDMWWHWIKKKFKLLFLAVGMWFVYEVTLTQLARYPAVENP
jgi:hypothetical protein